MCPATNRLPSPDAGLNLVQVALGVGVQNYTCASGVPVALGAIAVLYDADCALSNIDMLNSLPPLAVQTEGSTELLAIRVASQMAQAQLTIGVHYFDATGSPTFDFRQRGGKNIFFGAVSAKAPAPAGSSMGRSPTAFGAVPWLKLGSKVNGGSVGYKNVFRLVTAGGSPPSSCAGQSTLFSIPYAAEYWLYN